MASITLKNIPESLHVAYRHRAKANARSLQAEILHTLARNVVAPAEAGQLSVKDVTGMLKPRCKGITIEAMHEGIEQSLRRHRDKKGHHLHNIRRRNQCASGSLVILLAMRDNTGAAMVHHSGPPLWSWSGVMGT